MADSSKRSAAVVRLRQQDDERPDLQRAYHVGRLVSWEDGTPLVQHGAEGSAPFPARRLDSVRLPRPVPPGQPTEVLLVFSDGRRDLPIIVGVLASEARHDAPPAPSPEGELLEAKVDGRRVVLTAADEIELKCGKASVTLRRNGRLVLRGTYVEVEAEGVNRIKGGAVVIN